MWWGRRQAETGAPMWRLQNSIGAVASHPRADRARPVRSVAKVGRLVRYLGEDGAVVEIDPQLLDLVGVVELHDIGEPDPLVRAARGRPTLDPALADDGVAVDMVPVDMMGAGREELGVELEKLPDLVTTVEGPLTGRQQGRVRCVEGGDVRWSRVRVVCQFEVPLSRLDAHTVVLARGRFHLCVRLAPGSPCPRVAAGVAAPGVTHQLLAPDRVRLPVRTEDINNSCSGWPSPGQRIRPGYA